MACSRGARRSAVFLFKELNIYRQQLGHSCTSRAFTGNGRIVGDREATKLPVSFNSVPLRRFNTEVPTAADQMNLIRQLRERTSAPIKDVKSSLVSCNWDLDAAQKDLRKRGVVLASKKSSRTAAEGLLALAQTENKAVVVELNCETDFVARNDIFQYLASSLARTALLAESPTPQIQEAFPLGSEYFENMKVTLDHPKLSGETTAQVAITEVAAMVGENVKLRRGFVLSTCSHGVVCLTSIHTLNQESL